MPPKKQFSQTPKIEIIRDIAEKNCFEIEYEMNKLATQEGYLYNFGRRGRPYRNNQNFSLYCHLNNKTKQLSCKHKIYFENLGPKDAPLVGPFKFISEKSNLIHNHLPSANFLNVPIKTPNEIKTEIQERSWNRNKNKNKFSNSNSNTKPSANPYIPNRARRSRVNQVQEVSYVESELDYLSELNSDDIEEGEEQAEDDEATSKEYNDKNEEDQKNEQDGPTKAANQQGDNSTAINQIVNLSRLLNAEQQDNHIKSLVKTQPNSIGLSEKRDLNKFTKPSATPVQDQDETKRELEKENDQLKMEITNHEKQLKNYRDI
ncbi:uncharacterized protein L201_005748 [Kwoniella dendrophila CBS 6074]|uniref:SWIM-type domain-containing protein n=1 Tax=Kwoniella dendrophila CBS 6074 TaxID=1295534 RepID=A0AAX4JZE1_9TREE